jgi:hypothetical protein
MPRPNARCEIGVTVSLLPEYALLLDAIAPTPVARADHRNWDAGRWGSTVKIAEWHRLSPILFSHLRSDGHVPADVRAALEHAYLANAGRNLFVGASLRRVVDALSAADVPAVLLKGAALVETVYPDAAQREMLDLDLLVPPDRLAAANAALAPLGYRALPGSDGEQELRVAPHHDAPLIDPEQILAVELHRHVAIAGESNRYDIDEVWQRARPVPGEVFLLPAPEDLLLHVCLHFTRNRLGGSYRHRSTGGALAQICDIARLVEHEAIDWPAVSSAARRYRVDAVVFLALFAARELGVPVPAPALADLQPPGFDPALGRRLVTLRVLRTDDRLPVRPARWMLAPSREVLRRGWDADPTDPLSLIRAYARRARAHAPLVGAALMRFWTTVQDRRLNGQIDALRERP